MKVEPRTPVDLPADGATPSLLAPVLSRWCARVARAHPEWLGAVGDLARAPLDEACLRRLLEQERDTPDRRGYLDENHLRAVLRRLRARTLFALIERDLSGRADLAEVMATTSALADLSIQEAYGWLAGQLAAAYGVPTGEESGQPVDLLVVGMGKLGGEELNVSSDIDLVFVYEEDGTTQPPPGAASEAVRPLSNHEFFSRLGKRLIGVLADATEDGFVFRVDMRLRPNGDSGPLVASFAMLEEYFIVQGRDWERFAWIKARVTSQPVLASGTPRDAADNHSANVLRQLDDIVRPFVYRRYLDFGAIASLRNLHGQIRAEVARQDAAHPDRARNVKLGRGGIREIEFIAQHFQLIRGGRDLDLRDRRTLAVLDKLARKGMLDPGIAGRLARAYALLRNVEHRLQYIDDAQTHAIPVDESDRARLAAMCERLFAGDGPVDFATLSARLAEEQAFVADQFDEVFGARVPGVENGAAEAEGLWSAAVSAEETAFECCRQLTALGYADPEAALARLRALWSGSKVRMLAQQNRDRLDRLVPRAIEAAGQFPQAAATLGRLLDLLEAIAGRGAYLALLNEFPHALERVARVLAASPWAARYLIQHPILLDELLDDRLYETAPDWKEVSSLLCAELARHDGDTERQMDVLREVHHAQLFRLLTHDLDGRMTVETLADHLSALADLILDAALTACWRSLKGCHRDTPRFAVIGYGKLGGKELGYASDLDLIFLYDDEDERAPEVYARFAQRLNGWLSSRTTAGGLFEVDLELRPEGASGMVVSSLTAYRKYQESSAWLWEHQALTRARYCAGDPDIGVAFEALRRDILARPRDLAMLRREVNAMRQKMRAAHPAQSEAFDIKQDPGGMIDIEFCVQYLVLAYSHAHAELLDNAGNIALLKRSADAGLIDAGLAEQVADAYRAYRKRQHALRLAEARDLRVGQDEFALQSTAVKVLWETLMEPT